MDAPAISLGLFAALGLQEGRQVFWLDNPYVGYLVLAPLKERHPAKTFICIQISGVQMGFDDIVLVRFTRDGYWVEPITTQIDFNNLSYGTMVAAYDLRLRFWDVISLVITALAKRLGVELVDSETQYPVLAQQPSLVYETLQAVLAKAKLACVFESDDSQCALLRRELERTSFLHKGPPPRRGRDLEMWYFGEIMYQLTWRGQD